MTAQNDGLPDALSAAQRAAVGLVTLVAIGLFAYGAAGSYSSVSELAADRAVPLAGWVPLGVDGGLVGTALLDIVLTWIGMPLPWLRQLTRLLMLATVFANAAAGWPDPVATGLHTFAPVLVLTMTEAARAALLRRLHLTNGSYRQPIPTARWILALPSTFRLWRRMVLWQITNYPAVLEMEQRRLHALHRLATCFGNDWRTVVPADITWMLDKGIMLEDALTRIDELAATATETDHADVNPPARQRAEQHQPVSYELPADEPFPSNPHMSPNGNHPASYQPSYDLHTTSADEQAVSYDGHTVDGHTVDGHTVHEATPGREVPDIPQRDGKQPPPASTRRKRPATELRHQAWQWALSHRSTNGDIPAGKIIGAAFSRGERWGRMVKQAGTEGYL